MDFTAAKLELAELRQASQLCWHLSQRASQPRLPQMPSQVLPAAFDATARNVQLAELRQACQLCRHLLQLGGNV